MPDNAPAGKQRCSYRSPSGWRCPFAAYDPHPHPVQKTGEEASSPSPQGGEGRGEEPLCIFHLPIEKKRPEDFWRHLASYLVALLGKAGNDETEKWRKANPDHWVFREADRELVERYAAVISSEVWNFTGFVFPPMEETHNFAGFFFRRVDFRLAQFSGEAYFGNAQFSGEAYFQDAQFSGMADFTGAHFSGETSFRLAQFSGEAYFWDAQFSGPVYFTRAEVSDLMDFYRASLRNRLLFEGTRFAGDARVLLWSLDFVHGTSDIELEDGHRKGSIIEPAGQVVFRDISEGMNRVSFLHTDILTDRLCIRFSNVKWETDPREFIFDAKFAFTPHGEWNAATLKDKTGLPEESINLLPKLFFANRPPAADESDEQKRQREAEQLAVCESLVKQDVERIAREIRLSHEKYGSYPDAGNYYIAEMDFRRVRTPWTRLLELGSAPQPPLTLWSRIRGLPAIVRSFLYRLALESYRITSLYGERPNRAFWNLVALTLTSAIVYLFTGFRFQGDVVTRRLLRFELSQFWATLCDYCYAVLYAFSNMVPGWFRSHDFGPACRATSIVSTVQTVLSISILTLFLLAIRRRFRR
ncbi:MAG: pentapeptide repeat-containing protein [candidate division WOR-3 bacterium]